MIVKMIQNHEKKNGGMNKQTGGTVCEDTRNVYKALEELKNKQ